MGGFQSFPKGLVTREELVDLFDLNPRDDFAYVNPPFDPSANLKSFLRYDANITQADAKALNKAYSWMFRVFGQYMAGEFPSHEEVVSNFDGSTSAGFPYTQWFKDKASLFESWGTNWLKDLWVEWLRAPYQGIFKNFLKEELRKKGKDTRGILSGPLDMVYVMSRFFLNQNKGFYSAYLKTPSAVGISRDGLDWHALFLKLSKFPKGASIDYKKFDSKMAAELMRMIARFRKEVLLEHQAWAKPYIDLLYDQLIDTVCLVNGELLQKGGGNPSGSVNTVVDNTLVNFLITAYSYIKLYPEHDFEIFMRNVMFFLYGDDNTYTWDPSIDFSPSRLVDAIRRDFGYEVDASEVVPTEQLDFLSAIFGFHPVAGQVVAVPVFDHERMSCHVMYGPRNTTKHVEFQRIASLRALSCFDPEMVKKLDSWLLAHKNDVSHEDWNSLVPPLDLVRSRYLVPKHKEPLLIVQGFQALNDHAPLSVDMTDRGTWTRDVESKLDRAGLSADGKDWLMLALDPFPDAEHKRTGLPDGQVGRSVVLQYNQMITVTKPPTLGPDANWDCHVCLIPELMDPVINNKLVYGAGGNFEGTQVQDTGQFIQVNAPTSGGGPAYSAFPWRAPLMAVSVPSGTQTMPTDGLTNWFNPATMAVSGFDLTGYVGPQSRVIGMGFEVENVTNELNVQGGVSYYTIPTENVTAATGVSDLSVTPNWGGVRNVQLSRSPPATLAAAMSIPGSMSRKAKEGAYIQARISKGQPNPPIEPMRNTRVFATTAPLYANNTTLSGGFTCSPSANLTIGGQTNILTLPFSQPIPFDISGAYFNGLSGTSALNISLRCYIEVFPTTANQTLISTTQICPADDPIALELYSVVGRRLPPGCEVKFNSNGGWFKDLMKTIASVAPTIGSALGTVIPGGGMIGKAAGGLASMLGGMSFNDKTQKVIKDREKLVEDEMDAFTPKMVAKSEKNRAKRKGKQVKIEEVVEVQPAPRTGRSTSSRTRGTQRARSRSQTR